MDLDSVRKLNTKLNKAVMKGSYFEEKLECFLLMCSYVVLMPSVTCENERKHIQSAG